MKPIGSSRRTVVPSRSHSPVVDFACHCPSGGYRGGNRGEDKFPSNTQWQLGTKWKVDVLPALPDRYTLSPAPHAPILSGSFHFRWVGFKGKVDHCWNFVALSRPRHRTVQETMLYRAHLWSGGIYPVRGWVLFGGLQVFARLLGTIGTVSLGGFFDKGAKQTMRNACFNGRLIEPVARQVSCIGKSVQSFLLRVVRLFFQRLESHKITFIMIH